MIITPYTRIEHNTLHCNVTNLNTMDCTLIQYNTMECTLIKYNTMRYVLYCAFSWPRPRNLSPGQPRRLLAAYWQDPLGPLLHCHAPGGRGPDPVGLMPHCTFSRLRHGVADVTVGPGFSATTPAGAGLETLYLPAVLLCSCRASAVHHSVLALTGTSAHDPRVGHGRCNAMSPASGPAA